MTLPVTTPNVPNTYARLIDLGLAVRSDCLVIQAATANGGSVSADAVLRLLNDATVLQAFVAQVQANTALVTALQTYVPQAVGDATLNVATEFAASLTALNALVAAIVKDYPQDISGMLLDRKINADGSLTFSSLSSAQLPTVLPAITSWLATIT